MSEDLNKFPYKYSEFIDKKDALWDGDPAGDYIMADHINSIQNSIVDIERYLGTNANYTVPITDQLKTISSSSGSKIPSYYWHRTNPELNEKNITIFNQFSYNLFNQLTYEVRNTISQSNSQIIGVVDSQLPLNTFQTQVSEWVNAGAVGILINNFGLLNTRQEQQSYLDSVYDKQVQTIIYTNKVDQLYNNAIHQSYNPLGTAFVFEKETYVWYNNFGFTSNYMSVQNIHSQIYPHVIGLKNKNLKIIGQANISTQKAYNYIHVLAILLSIEGLSVGVPGGSNSPFLFDWYSPISNWQTDNPKIHLEGNRLYRNVLDGSIILEDTGNSQIKGSTLSSSTINFVNNSIPGDSLIEASIPPNKLSGYDIAKIVQLLNDSSSDIQINLQKIKFDAEGALPANIPAENMMTNVILAINKANDPLSTNNIYIDKNLITEVNASALVGYLPPELYEKGLIKAINDNNDEFENFLNVRRIDVHNINMTGNLSGANEILSGTITADYIDSLMELQAVNTFVSGKHTAYQGYYEELEVDELFVETIDGVKNLNVENLNADNIGTLILDAIEANIGTGVFNQIVTKSLEAETIKADLIVALNSITDNQITNSALIGEGVIMDAHIVSIDANKLTAGTIDTGQIDLSSPEGHLRIQDSTIKVYDSEDALGQRKLRIAMGNIGETGVSSIDNQNLGYGLIVLGPDGETRLYDHTGVYSAGLHDNVISEEKLQDDSISSRTIQVGAILADHIQAESIVGEKIAGETIDATKIVANTITANEIASHTITAAEIASGTITGEQIHAGAIDAKHIMAGVIDAEKLSIGYMNNLIQDGYDSFEQYPPGPIELINYTGSNINTVVSTQWRREGKHSLRISGPNSINAILLTDKSYWTQIQPGNEYMVSAYFRLFSDIPVDIRIGLKGNNSEVIWGPVTPLTADMRDERFFARVTAPEGSLTAVAAIEISAVNTEVYVDAIQIEEVTENIKSPGMWRPTSTTRISGTNITTGTVAADRIKIGSGTIFGDGDVIEITDAGFKAQTSNGYAMLNSSGLEVRGGAINIQGGTAGNKIAIDGNNGIEVEGVNALVKINPLNGLEIYSKTGKETILSIHPSTGKLQLSGTAEFMNNHNQPMSLQEVTQTIDTRRQVFTEQPIPPYMTGDLWIKKDTQDLYYANRQRVKNQEFYLTDWSPATGYTDDSSLKNFVHANDRQRSIHLHMLVHNSSFNQSTPNYLYFVGYERDLTSFENIAVDKDGHIFDYQSNKEVGVPRQSLNLQNLEEGTSGYLIFETRSKKICFIYFNKEIEEYYAQGSETLETRVVREGWKVYNPVIDNHQEYIELGTNTYIIGELTR